MSFTALMWGVVFFVSVLGALWALERMQEDEA